MTIKENIETILVTIESLKDSILFSNNVKIMAVTKGQPINKIEEAINCGIIHFGENYVQEAQEKWVYLKEKYPAIKLHLIGKLQSNKIKVSLTLFDFIHTVDSVRLAEKIAQQMKDNNIVGKSFFIQVKLDEDNDNKNGVAIEQLTDLVNLCKKNNMSIMGLMGVPPVLNSPAPSFALMLQLTKLYQFTELSIGMSKDFISAITFGATFVRLGTIIFGERQLKR